MTCPNCKYSIPEGMQYCPNCGNLLSTSMPTSAGVPTQRIDTPTAPQQQRRITAPLEPLIENPPYQEPVFSLPSPQPLAPSLPAAPQVVPRGTLPNTTYVVPAPRNNNSAIVSLVFGILSWVVLPIIGPIIAVVAGHMALNQIRAADGQQDGRGMAIAGLILGYIQLGLLLIGCAIMVIFGLMFAQM